MTTFEIICVVLDSILVLATIGMFIVALLTFLTRKKKHKHK